MKVMFSIGMLSLLTAGYAIAEEVTAGMSGLEFISYTTQPGKGLQLQFNLDGDAPQPTSFTTNRPARITFDLPNVKNNLPWTLPLPITDGGRAKSVSAVEAEGRTRVVINLDELVPYTTRVEGKTIYVTLTDGSVGGGGQAVEESIPQAEVVDEQAVVIEKAKPSGGANSIENVEYAALPGGRVQVKLKFSSQAREPNSFTITDPARLVLDFPDTANNLSWSTQNVGVGSLSNIAVIAAGTRTRVVLGMVSMQPFETKVIGKEVVLLLEGEGTGRAIADAGIIHRVEGVDFRRGDAGEGRIIVRLSDKNVSVDTREEGGRIIVDFNNTELPKELVQRLDVIDFATPVQYIDSVVADNKARLIVTPIGQYKHLAYQSNNIFTLDVKQLDKKELLSQEPQYTGEKLSLNFQDIEVRAVLQLIADFTGLNMVASDTVSGNLTLRLKNVPWDQALDIVLKTKGLGMRRQGNIILVAPAEELAAREKVEMEAEKQVADLAPLHFEIIQVNYAKASDIAGLLKGEKNTLLSERGSVTVDERTNTLLVSDTGNKLAEVRKLVAKLDITVRQVMIESRIVIADDDFAKDLGVMFGINRVKQSRQTLYMTSGSFTGTDTMIDSALDNAATTGSYFPVDILTGSTNRLNVNMPVSNPLAPRIALGVLNGGNLLDLELSALQTEGRGEVISNPRVITSNKQEATIKQGTEIPYAESAGASGATSISFKEAVLSLKVTPQITPDDRIIMDLTVNKDSVGQIFNNVPSIDTKEVKTQILVDNGQTVVLGGVFEQAKVHTVNKVPFLGDIPLLGALFRNKHDTDEKAELLIFITPKIIKEGVVGFE